MVVFEETTIKECEGHFHVTDQEKRPLCYARLETVFPIGKDGLRHSPEKCMACPHKTPCLRGALSEDPAADEVHEERVDRAYESGSISFFSRWSRKKRLASKKRQRQ